MTSCLRRNMMLVVVALVAATTGWIALRWDTPAAETAHGTDPGFDQLLRDAGTDRRFLFDQGNRLVLADLAGDRPDEIALDLTQATGRPAGRTFWSTISPDRRRVALEFLPERTIPPPPELLVLDLATGQVVRPAVPSPSGDPTNPTRGAYELDLWSLLMPLPHWLSDTTFLAGLVWYPTGAPHEYRHKLLRYDVDKPSAPAVVEGLPDRVYPIAAPNGVLFLGDGGPRGKERVWVPTATGLRLATPAERDRYDHLSRTQYSEKSAGGPSEVTVTNDRELRVNGKLLRRIDSVQSSLAGPQWDPDLNVYRWEESDRGEQFTAVAAPDGRFRRWHTGRYIGWVPAP